MKLKLSFLLLQFFNLSSTIITIHALSQAATRIKVCQNKDCTRRFQQFDSSGNLVQTFSDLLPPSSHKVTVESTGCLGNCGKGPNVAISNGGSEKIYGAVDDGLMASAILEVGGGIISPDKLVIAVEGLARVSRVTSPEKKITILTPIIKSLASTSSSTEEVDQDALHESTALAHALILRADAYLEQAQLSPNTTIHIDKAHVDVQMAISIDHLDGRAYRLLADVEEAMGNVIGAMEAVSKWAEVNPSFGTKARKRLARLASTGSDRGGGGCAP